MKRRNFLAGLASVPLVAAGVGENFSAVQVSTQATLAVYSWQWVEVSISSFDFEVDSGAVAGGTPAVQQKGAV